MPEPTNQASVLVRKATADAIAVRELAGNPEIWLAMDVRLSSVESGIDLDSSLLPLPLLPIA